MIAVIATISVTATWPNHAAADVAFDHAFDPELSLEGDCNAEDGIADPGCPYAPPPGGPQPFLGPCGIASDPHGDIYVANPTEGDAGRIDVFDPKGNFLTEIPDANRPCQLAVDSTGRLYAVDTKRLEVSDHSKVARYDPQAYPPVKGTSYTAGPVLEFNGSGDECKTPRAVAVDPSNDHLYVGHDCRVDEYGSAADGNPLLKCCIGEGLRDLTGGLDVYGSNHDVYVTRGNLEEPASVFVFDGSSGSITCTLSGNGSEKFDFESIGGAIAINQANGELYVDDLAHHVVDQFKLDGGGDGACPQYSYNNRLPAANKTPPSNVLQVDVAVDGPCRTGLNLGESCNVGGAYDSPNEGEVYLSAGTSISNSHMYAFEPRSTGAPEIEAQTVSGVGESEAVLRARLNSHNLATAYHFEYVSQAEFDADEYANATSVPVPDNAIAAGSAFVSVAIPVTDLQPGARYHFRLVASNCEDPGAEEGNCLTMGEGTPGGEGEDASFATYAPPPSAGSCSNAALRTGASAALPDCRAYELVTPPDTSGHVPTMNLLGAEANGVGSFATALSSADGQSLIFGSNSGSLPGIGGGGRTDTYRAQRDPINGWQSGFTGLSGSQSPVPRAGGVSADHRYAFWLSANGTKGSLDVDLGKTNDVPSYLRRPDGSPAPSPNCDVAAEPFGRFEWVGCGSLGFDPVAAGKWISSGGDHVIFTSQAQLESCGPPNGKTGIYDRTPGELTRCVALHPNGSPPSKDAEYDGVSADGSAVAFGLGDGALYVKPDSAPTLEVATGTPTFGGLSSDGARVFYLKGGDVFACDLDEGGCAGEGAHAPIPVGSGGDSTLGNVSADGSHAYFVSGAVLTGSEENEFGAKAKASEENLYAWDGSSVRFIAAVDPLDVTNKPEFGGLGNWVTDVLNDSPSTLAGPGADPSRTTPDGTALVFQSRANLTGQDSGGHTQVYRYEGAAGPGARLLCLSCDPTGASNAGDARLQAPYAGNSASEVLPPVNMLVRIANITDDGQRVFFQSAARLASADVDSKIDVYEWLAQGVEGCTRQAGCLALISGGESVRDDYLYAMSGDGRNVFFLSADRLISQDPDATYSVYDARVEGGFPVPPVPSGECLGEACQPAVTPPDAANPASASFHGQGNPHAKPSPRCAKGRQRAARRAGKKHGCPHHARKHRGHQRRLERGSQR